MNRNVVRSFQVSLFIGQTYDGRYVGNSAGNVRVLKLEQEHIVQMKYTIPYSASHG